MASYRKRDLNRFVKIYPYVRFPPRYVYEYDSIVSPGVEVEAAKITFTNADIGSYTFLGTYTSIPAVTITTVNVSAPDDSNVAATITSLTTTQVTVKTSENFTGEIHLHIAKV